MRFFIVWLSLVSISASAYPRRIAKSTAYGVQSAECEAGQLFPAGKLASGGDRVIYFGGKTFMNYHVAFVPTMQDGVILAKIWAPGFDAYDAYGFTEAVRCKDPRK